MKRLVRVFFYVLLAILCLSGIAGLVMFCIAYPYSLSGAAGAIGLVVGGYHLAMWAFDSDDE